MPHEQLLEYWADQRVRILKQAKRTETMLTLIATLFVAAGSLSAAFIVWLWFQLGRPSPIAALTLVTIEVFSSAYFGFVAYLASITRCGIIDVGIVITRRRLVCRRILCDEIVDIETRPLFIFIKTMTSPKRLYLRCIDPLDMQILRATWLRERENASSSDRATLRRPSSF